MEKEKIVENSAPRISSKFQTRLLEIIDDKNYKRTELASLIGISKDTVVSHKKFEEKYQLPIILLANPELDVLQAYDVWKEKNMYGRMVMGVVRTTYLINEEGIIEKAFTKVKAADDAERMLREIESE